MFSPFTTFQTVQYVSWQQKLSFNNCHKSRNFKTKYFLTKIKKFQFSDESKCFISNQDKRLLKLMDNNGIKTSTPK